MGSVCDVTAQGAKGDGVSIATVAIQKAIDDCAAHGGGIVWFPAGDYLSGTLVLKSNITLHLTPGATLWGSKRIEDFRAYPSGTKSYHLIYASGANNITIEGSGAIRGNGEAYWDPDPTRVYVARRPRPSPLLEFVDCRNVRIENISIFDAPGWTIHPLDCDGVTIHGIRIVNNGHGPNTDGIDPDSSRNVVISDSYIHAGDDCIVLKTAGRLGGKTMPTENVTVSNNILTTDDNAFKMGTESLGDFRNISVTNLTVFHAADIYRPPTSAIAIEMVDGSTLENVAISNIAIHDARTPIFVRLGNRGGARRFPHRAFCAMSRFPISWPPAGSWQVQLRASPVTRLATSR
jgi:polygalacturonase